MCGLVNRVVARQVSTLTVDVYAFATSGLHKIATMAKAPALAALCDVCGWKFSSGRYQYVNCDCGTSLKDGSKTYYDVEDDR